MPSLFLSLSLASIWVQLKQLKLGFNVKIWLIWSWCKSGESTHFSHPTLLYWVPCGFGWTHTDTHTHNHGCGKPWNMRRAKVFNWSLGSNSLSLDIRKQRSQRGQVKCSSSPAGSRSSKVIAQSPCPSVWPCGMEGTGAYESEYQSSTCPLSGLLWAPFPPLKWGRRHQPHRLGGGKRHASKAF